MDGIVRMRTIAFTPDRAPTLRRIRLGYEGDNLVERLEFDLPEIAQGQTATLMITGADAVTLDRTDDGRYAVDLTRDMIGPDGEREAYVRIDGAGGEAWQSAPMKMVTGALPDVEEEIEKQYPTAVGQMLTAMAEHSSEMDAQEERVEQAAQRAEEAAERAEAGGGGSGSSGSAVEIDTTLTQDGKAADAKATGDRLSELSKEMADVKITDYEVTADGKIRMLDESKRHVAVEYLGLNSSVADSDKKQILTPVSADVVAGRIYYQFKAQKGDLISIVPTEYWTESSYQYEPVEVDANGVILRANGFANAQTSQHITIFVHSDDVAEVRLGIRYTGASRIPAQWGVVDNDFEKAFVVTVTRPGEGAGYSGHYVVVNGDGLLRISDFPMDGTALEATADGRICISEAFARQSIPEYLGLCTAAGTTGQKHNLMLNATPSTAGARIYYQFKARMGDIITIQKTESWTQSQFMYEALELSDDLTIQFSPTFSTAYNDTVESVVQKEGTTLVRLALRLDYTTVPSGWGVVDDDFENAFVVSVNNVALGSKYKGQSVVVGKDGRLCVGGKYGEGNVTPSCLSGLTKGAISTGSLSENLPIWAGLIDIHRGWATAPNNTLQSIWLSKKNGYSCCEIDLRETSDGVVVLAHDATVTGTVNGVSTTYTVAAETYDTLSELVYVNSTYDDCHIARFDDVLRLCGRTGMVLVLDIKVSTVAFVEKVLSLVMQYGMIEHVLFFCWQNASIMSALKTKNPRVNLMVNAFPSDLSAYDSYLEGEGKFIICVPADSLAQVTSEARATLAGKGYLFGVWGLTEAKLAEAMALEPFLLEPTDGEKSIKNWYDLIDKDTRSRFNVSW